LILTRKINTVVVFVWKYSCNIGKNISLATAKSVTEDMFLSMQSIGIRLSEVDVVRIINNTNWLTYCRQVDAIEREREDDACDKPLTLLTHV